jgi:uncharacterized protein YjcR
MSGSGYLMTLEEKAERRRAMVALYEIGTQPADIAKHFGVTANYVRALLREAGWEVTPPAQNKASIWDLEGPELRRAIRQRAADGARQRLNEMGADA